MARFGFLLIAIIAVIIAISTLEVSALKCWTCDNRNQTKGCGEKFFEEKMDKSNITECIGPNMKCNKVIHEAKSYNQWVSRGCVSEAQQKILCGEKKVGFCETCDSDECNGASQYGPIAMLIAIPIMIASILHQ